MKTIKYIISKIINNSSVRFRSYNFAPLLRIIGKPQCKLFHFDFSSETTHLGDRLFFIPLVYSLRQKSIVVTFNKEEHLFQDIYYTLFGGFHSLDISTSPTGEVVLPSPSYADKRHKYKDFILVDFTDISAKQKVSDELISSFSKLLEIDLTCDWRAALAIYQPPVSQVAIKNKSYVFNNYINSGFFRKYFVSEQKLSMKARELSSMGYKIIHLGSESDKKNDCNSYDFVDYDLRGVLSVSQTVQLMFSPNVLGAVTYDNFIMHLCGIYNRRAYVLFRGRFLKKNFRQHMTYINNTFFLKQNEITYL